MTEKSTPLPPLETSLEEVTQLIDKMEHGELTLQQSLEHFERGIVLIKHCQKVLEEAEQKVQILMQNKDKEASLVDYHETENDNNIPSKDRE